jgi:hypothetical protein
MIPVITNTRRKRLFADTDMHDPKLRRKMEDFYRYLQKILREDQLIILSNSYDKMLEIMCHEDVRCSDKVVLLLRLTVTISYTRHSCRGPATPCRWRWPRSLHEGVRLEEKRVDESMGNKLHAACQCIVNMEQSIGASRALGLPVACRLNSTILQYIHYDNSMRLPL